MATVCRPGFDASWTCQSAAYDHELVLEKECRYFVTAFLNGYLDLSVRFEDLFDAFQDLARRAAACRYRGFMHRDMQSRNIMVYKDQGYFIDFQGGRIGPLAYDLASLLIDPYVALPSHLAGELYDRYLQELSDSMEIDRSIFRKEYEICRLTRNLQILGAFGHLARNKGKSQFEAYIPAALETLNQNLHAYEERHQLPGLGKVVHQAREQLEILNRKP
jgi:aminoglycoside/choline kinase family phosphotransferase